ncbi:MAG: S-adenosylmethionine decarboxylase [Actinomycetota bacterium]|nr:S-adenosylmethionine decarboxylase [Actinomycetota bacterium]
MNEVATTVESCDGGLIGRTVCVDYAGCEAVDVLRDQSLLRSFMDEFCAEVGIRVISNASKSFGPGAGVTSVNVLATSSLTVHTWPEVGAACIDLFSCKINLDDEFVERFFAGVFRAATSTRTSFDRVAPDRVPAHASAALQG